MRKGLIIFILVAIITLFCFAGLIYYSINQLEPSTMPIKALEGKIVWQQKGCVECHTLFGNGGYVAPDLTKEYSRRRESWIKDFLTIPPPVRPSKQKRHLQLTEEEAANIIEYLKFINEISITENWPPSR